MNGPEYSSVMKAADPYTLWFLLPARAHNALRGIGVTTLGQLCLVSVLDLLRIDGVGWATCQRVLRTMYAFGLTLKDEIRHHDLED